MKKQKILGTTLALTVLTGATFGLCACAGDGEDVSYSYPEYIGNGRYSTDGTQPDRLLGSEGLVLLGGSKKSAEESGVGIGVNSYLWRATLDTLSFMPLASADPFGGVIITDWYTPPETPKERFKINAFIMTKALRADGIKVTVFKQQMNAKNAWIEAAVPSKTATAMEDAILVRAREMRIAQTPKK